MAESLLRRLGRATAAGVLAGLALLFISTRAHAGLPVAVCLLLPLVIVISLQLLALSVSEAPLPDEPEPMTTWPAGEYLHRLRRTERQLEAGIRDGDKFDRTVRPQLAQLAFDRLRYKHGVDLRRDPGPAREILGEPLWQLINPQPDRPPTAAPSRAQLAALVAAIEAI